MFCSDSHMLLLLPTRAQLGNIGGSLRAALRHTQEDKALTAAQLRAEIASYKYVAIPPRPPLIATFDTQTSKCVETE